jgi:hypothetical protein
MIRIRKVALILVPLALVFHGCGHSRSRESRESSSASKHTTQTVDLRGAKSARASLEMPAGHLSIGGGANQLLDADFTYNDSFEAPRVDYSVAGSVGRLNISQESHSRFGRSENDWNLHFSNDVPLDLRIHMGAGQGDLRFRDIPLTRLELNIGAGQMDVDFTARASGGIGSIDVHGLKHQGDSYTNDAYGKSPTTIRLKVEGGVGQITLTQEP